MVWSGVGAGLSAGVWSRVKWCRSGVGAGLNGVVRCGSRVKWCGLVWEPG